MKILALNTGGEDLSDQTGRIRELIAEEAAGTVILWSTKVLSTRDAGMYESRFPDGYASVAAFPMHYHFGVVALSHYTLDVTYMAKYDEYGIPTWHLSDKQSRTFLSLQYHNLLSVDVISDSHTLHSDVRRHTLSQWLGKYTRAPISIIFGDVIENCGGTGPIAQSLWARGYRSILEYTDLTYPVPTPEYVSDCAYLRVETKEGAAPPVVTGRVRRDVMDFNHFPVVVEVDFGKD